MPKEKIDLAMTMASLMKATARERRWDRALGGDQSRPYRDIMIWTLQRLLGLGAELEDVLNYLSESAELG